MNRLILTLTTLAALTVTTFGVVGTAAAETSVDDGSIVVLGPFPLEVADTVIETEPLVVYMNDEGAKAEAGTAPTEVAPTVLRWGLFELDLTRGIARPLVQTTAHLIEMEPMRIVVDSTSKAAARAGS